MEEFQNESPEYKDDFIYSYGNAKQGIHILHFLTNFVTAFLTFAKASFEVSIFLEIRSSVIVCDWED